MDQGSASLTMASNPRNVSKVEGYLEALLQELHVNPDVYGNILISVTEAVTNAIMHGNQRDENKKVCVDCNRRREEIAFTIRDEGDGFNYGALPDPTEPCNRLKLHGRGVFLMRQLSDNLVFHNNGNTVEIKFDLC